MPMTQTLAAIKDLTPKMQADHIRTIYPQRVRSVMPLVPS